MSPPALSVVLPAPLGAADAMRSIEANAAELASVGGELVVVDPTDDRSPLPEGTVRVQHSTDDMFVLAAAGILVSTGDIIGIGEDHAAPRPGWAAAVLAAHARHPDAPAVCGSLANGTARTLCGRVNFLSFAAPWTPGTTTLTRDRTPPTSVLTIKRSALATYEGDPHHLEVVLLNRWMAERRLVADFDIVVDHYQDHGWAWTCANAFRVARALFADLADRQSAEQRRLTERHAVQRMGPSLLREVRSHPDAGPAEVLGAVPLIAARVAGAVVGLRVGASRRGVTDVPRNRRRWRAPSAVLRASGSGTSP